MAVQAFDIEQTAPLANTVPLRKTTQSSSAHSSIFHRNYKWLVPLILGLFAAGSFFFLAENGTELLPKDATTVKTTSGDSGSGSENLLLNLPKMLLAFQEKRQKWFHQLEQDYGKENFHKMLLDHGRSAIRPPNEKATTYSNGRMRRKMMIKILEAQEAATSHHRNLQTNSNGYLQSNSTDTDTTAESSAQRTRRQAGFTNSHEFPKYIWATGGHRQVSNLRDVAALTISRSFSRTCMLYLHSLSLSFSLFLSLIHILTHNSQPSYILLALLRYVSLAFIHSSSLTHASMHPYSPYISHTRFLYRYCIFLLNTAGSR
jgi:hypothetical protein